MIGVWIIGGVLFVGAIGCAITSLIVLSDMAEDINRVSPEQESPMGWHFGKLRRVQQYARLAIAVLVSGLRVPY